MRRVVVRIGRAAQFQLEPTWFARELRAECAQAIERESGPRHQARIVQIDHARLPVRATAHREQRTGESSELEFFDGQSATALRERSRDRQRG